jgi:putative membrane protein
MTLDSAAAILAGAATLGKFDGAALAQQTLPNCGPFMGGHWYGWFFGPLVMLAFLAAAVAVVVLIVRALSGGHSAPRTPSPGSSNTALDILKERFARGEIDKDEFEERRSALGA